MGERVTSLADEYEQVLAELITVVGGCTDAQWRGACADEGWPVGVTAHHVADWWPVILPIVRALAAGESFSVPSLEEVHEKNVRHAREQADCTKEETLALLRQGGAEAAATIRSLSDEQLDRAAPIWAGREMSLERLITFNLIGHARTHASGIRAAIAQADPAAPAPP